MKIGTSKNRLGTEACVRGQLFCYRDHIVEHNLKYFGFAKTEDIRLKSTVFGKNTLGMITGRKRGDRGCV